MDARSLRDISIVTASFLYFCAAAGRSDVPWLAEITLDRGYKEIGESAAASVERITKEGVLADRIR